MRKLVFLVLVLCLVGSASAATFLGTVDNDWFNTGNWDTSAVPTSADAANIVANAAPCAGVALVAGGHAVAGQTNVAVWGGPATLDISATGTSLFNNSFIGVAGAGQLDVSGTAQWSGQLRIGMAVGTAGSGTLNLYEGGLISTGWLVGCPFDASANSQSNLYGGTIISGGPFSMNGTSATTNMDIEAGHLYFAGFAPTDAQALVDTMVADGRITAYGGAGTVMSGFDGGMWKMHVWAVPEPMTICLLGLGGLFLRRRK